MRDRAPHATRRLVPLDGQRRVVPARPRLQQRGLEQGQRAGLGADVVEDAVEEAVLEDQAGAAGRLFDRPLELVGPHRSHEQVRPAEELRELGVLGAPRVVVGTDGGEHATGGVGVVRRVHEHVEEARPDLLVATDREHLFELVDDDHHHCVAVRTVHRPFREARDRRGVLEQLVADVVCRCGLGQRRQRPRELEHRIGAGGHEHPRPLGAPGQRVVGQRGDEPGAGERRLPAAGRADDTRAPGAGDRRDQIGDQPLAPEVPPGVLGLEPQQTLVRTRTDRGAVARPRGPRPPGRGALVLAAPAAEHAVGDDAARAYELDLCVARGDERRREAVRLLPIDRVPQRLRRAPR